MRSIILRTCTCEVISHLYRNKLDVARREGRAPGDKGPSGRSGSEAPPRGLGAEPLSGGFSAPPQAGKERFLSILDKEVYLKKSESELFYSSAWFRLMRWKKVSEWKENKDEPRQLGSYKRTLLNLSILTNPYGMLQVTSRFSEESQKLLVLQAVSVEQQFFDRQNFVSLRGSAFGTYRKFMLDRSCHFVLVFIVGGGISDFRGKKIPFTPIKCKTR